MGAVEHDVFRDYDPIIYHDDNVNKITNTINYNIYFVIKNIFLISNKFKTIFLGMHLAYTQICHLGK